MRVTGLLIDLQKRFPKSPLDAWEQTYVDELKRFEGDALFNAYREIMGGWTESYPPRPAHITAAIKVEKPATEDKRQPWEVAADSRLKRARELLETARAECAEALAQDWGGYAHVHLVNATQFVARLELAGVSIMDALARFNGAETRKGYPKRAPDAWLDQSDYEIFAQRLASQSKIRGKKMGPLNRTWKRLEISVRA